jgi:acetylornithine deacetylase/succinyl-diaminopimelate desuccinylase-like protein
VAIGDAVLPHSLASGHEERDRVTGVSCDSVRAVSHPAAATLASLLLLATSAPAQVDDVGERLLEKGRVRAALEAARKNEPQVIEEQIRLSEIPAPPFAEEVRAEAFRQVLEQLGLERVRIDAAGNVLGERPGRELRPHVVLSAHLDTVFPEGTDLEVTREGPVLRAPGIGDDARGLAVLIGVIRALAQARVETTGRLTFVATVGEEGLGDLRGVKYLFETELAGEVDRFVSVDGTRHDLTNVAVGSYRYRVTFEGPGGHSYGSFGLVNPIHALGRAIAGIGDLVVPSEPRTTFNVGRVGGGTSINAIAFEAWMEVDLRSSDVEALAALDTDFHAAVDAAVVAENGRWPGEARVRVRKERVGTRPAGRIQDASPVLRAARSVTRALGLTHELSEGSTDSNIPMSLGIPAVTIGGGGSGEGAHSLQESWDSTNSWKGTQRALLLAIALTEPLAD